MNEFIRGLKEWAADWWQPFSVAGFFWLRREVCE